MSFDLDNITCETEGHTLSIFGQCLVCGFIDNDDSMFESTKDLLDGIDDSEE
jgi:hypothetical protein